jgi:lysylphosphatidylglycerol synthetase-like protein (DUF2156 family)
MAGFKMGSFGALVTLTGSRLKHLPFLASDHHGFDVESAHHDGCRSLAANLLHEHAELAGQVHALTRDDWKVFWGTGRKAFVPFREGAFSLITWRDPVGQKAARSEVLRLFRQYAARLGKHVVLIGISEKATRDAESEGYRPLWVGSEQIFDFPTFHTRGRRGEKIRLATNHGRRIGLRAREIFPCDDARDCDLMMATDRAWKLARPARDVRSFLRTEPMENASMRRYFVVEKDDEPEVVQSFLVCSPVSWRGWYLQDLVRHPRAPRGATEIVTLTAIERLRDDGAEFVTAGIVPFLESEARPSDLSTHGVARWAVQYFDRLFRFSGLKQFRSKFPATRTEPIFVAYWPKVVTPLVVWDLARVLS